MMFELYWDDLTKEAQQKVLDEFGENLNWDVLPMVTVETDEGEEDAE